MEKGFEIAIGITVEVVFGAAIMAVLYLLYGRIFATPKRLKVLPLQKGVILDGNQVVRVVDPGSNWITPKRALVVCDMRPKPFQLAGAEAISSDGMAIRVSLGGEYRVADPAKFVTESSDAFGTLYVEIRQAVNTAVSELESGNFVSGAPVADRVKELVIPRSVQLGIELRQLDLSEAFPIGRPR